MKEKLKKFFIQFAKYILIFIILICLYIATLITSSLIPSKLLKNNVTQSSEILKVEGEKKFINLGYKKELLFLFTDALMINTAYSVDSKNLLESCILARKNYIPGQTATVYIDSQYDLGASQNYKDRKRKRFPNSRIIWINAWREHYRII